MIVVILLAALPVLALLLWRGARRRAGLERELAELRRSSRVDPATALRSAVAFTEDLELELERAARTGRPACLVVLAWAAPAGAPMPEGADQELAKAIRAALRVVDLGYRIGAREFALLLPDARATGAALAVTRLRLELGRRGAAAGPIRAGIAELGPGIDRRALFQHAYCALLACDHSGRPDIVIYGPELERGVDQADLPAGPVEA